MSERRKLFRKTLNLTDLETEVAAFEAIGPLTKLDRTEQKTVGVYTQGAPPTNPVELRPGTTVDGGYEEVCRGRVWITSQAQDVIAIRKKDE